MSMQMTLQIDMRDFFAMSATMKDLEPYTTYHPFGTKLDVPTARYAFADAMLSARAASASKPTGADIARTRVDALREARAIFLSVLPVNGRNSRIEAIDDLIASALHE